MLDLSPTGSPGVDALVSAAQAILKEPEYKDSLQFHRHVEELQAFRRSLERKFRDSLRFYPRTDLLQQLESQLDQEFERFRGGCRRLETYLQTFASTELELGCQRIHQATITLMAISAKLRAQEEAWRQQFGEGLSGELRFFITQTLEGKLAYQQCAQILDKSLEACRQMEQAMGKVKPENEAVSEILDHCTVTLADLTRALQRTCQSLRLQHSWEIEEHLSHLLEAVEALTTTHNQLLDALYPVIICTKCSGRQRSDRPVCINCGCRLPLTTYSPLPPPTPEARARFQAFAELEGKLTQLTEGSITAETALTWIDQFRQRLSLGKRQIQADQKLDKHCQEVLLEATGATETAMNRLKQAIQNNLDLDEFMEEIHRAEERMDLARQIDLTQSTPNS